MIALHAAEGDTVEVGAVLAEISTDPNATPSATPAAAPSAAAPAEAPPAAPAEPAPSLQPASSGNGPEGLFAVVLPEMESVVEGTVIEWYKKPGDAVAQNEDLCEISTDKVDTPVPSPVAGVLAQIAVPEGETFAITDPICYLALGVDAVIPAAGQGAPAAGDGPTARPAEATGGPPATPVARRLAAASGVDLGAVTGTGPAGMITKQDVAGSPSGNGAAKAAPAGDEGQLLKGPSAVLAQYMDDSLKVPTATSFRTLSVAVLDAQRRQINGDLAAAGRKEKLSFTHLIAWAIIVAGSEIPNMNTGFERRETKPYALRRENVYLGLAVDVERKDGGRTLMVPVIKDANVLGFNGFRGAYDDLVKRTRTGGITPDELRGASITLTNPGGIGTIASVPRLMAGQGTIVATGSIAYPPGLHNVPGDRLRELGVEKVMTMTSTYDHRVIQGAESGAFLARVDALLEGADGFYDQVRAAIGLGAAVPVARAGRRRPRPPSRPEASSPAPPRWSCMAWVGVAMSVVKATRSHGHLAATLDPLGSRPPGDPALDPSSVGLTPEMMAKIPTSVLRLQVPGESFLAALPNLQKAYCGDIAYEIEHISSHEQRFWWRKHIEIGDLAAPLEPGRKIEILERLAQVDAFERFLRAPVPRPEDLLDRGRGLDGPAARRDHRAAGARSAPRRSCSAWPTAAGSRSSPTSWAARSSRSWASSRATSRRTSSTRRTATSSRPPATSSTTSAPRASYGPGPATRSPSPWPPTRATSSRSTPVAEGTTRAPRRPTAAARGRPRPQRRGAGHHPRRRGLLRPGRRGRDPEPAGPARLHDRRHDPHHRQQPDRVHHRPAGLALDPERQRPGPRLRYPDHPRERRRHRGVIHAAAWRVAFRSTFNRDVADRPRSATAASATTRSTSRPTPSRS